MTTTYILLAVLILLLIVSAAAYNGLVSARNRTDEALADIDVQLKRRADLIPNLVESVKGYVKQEAGVLESVTAARANAVSAGAAGSPERAAAENQLTGTLRSLFAVTENYPDLKSSANFQQLSGELRDTEDKIQAARRFANANVRDFNTKVQSLPTSLFAAALGFKPRELIDLDDDPASRQPVKVQF